MSRPSTVLRPCAPLALAFSALVLGLAPGCGGERARDSEARGGADTAAAGAPVLAVVAVQGGGAGPAALEGFLEPVVDAVVPARTAGVVREVLVREGDRVAAGAVLARLEDEEQRLEVEYTGALADQAAAELVRAEKGAAGQFVSQQTLDAARAKARATRVDLDLAKLAYARRTLRAPVAGVVWQVRAERHRLVAADDVLFRVTDPSRLRVEFDLPAAASRRVARGDAVRLVPGGSSDGTALTGRVTSVSPLVDPTTGRVRVVVETTGDRALVGQTVRADLDGVAGTASGAILPRDALLAKEGDALAVWLVKDGVVRRTPIEAGAFGPDGIEVIAGLAPGDLVAARGASPPADGAKVRPRLGTSGD